MKKFWLILEIVDAFLLLVGGTIGVLCFVVMLLSGAITAITGTLADNCVSDFCGIIFGVIFHYVFPIWCLIWIMNGVHAVSLLNKK